MLAGFCFYKRIFADMIIYKTNEEVEHDAAKCFAGK